MIRAHPDITVEEGFFLALNDACTLVQKYVEEGLQSAGVTLVEYTMLRIIERKPGILPRDITMRLFATASGVSHIVSRLERRGMIVSGQDAMDARLTPLTLSAKGAKHLQYAKSAVEKHVRAIKLPDGLLPSMANDLTTFVSILSPLVHESR